MRALPTCRSSRSFKRNILDGIDWELLARHPRAYVGYSDLTPLLSQVVTRLGLTAIHGPMVAVEMARGLEPSERQGLLIALAGQGTLRYRLAGPGRGPVVWSLKFVICLKFEIYDLFVICHLSFVISPRVCFCQRWRNLTRTRGFCWSFTAAAYTHECD